MKTTFFRVLCNQNHIHMGFGYNSESIEELAQDYLTYKSINWDSEETEAHYRSLPCKDVIALMLDDEFEIEQSNAPFEDLE
jgi:hypothetical protein